MVDSSLRWLADWWSSLPAGFAFLLALPFAVAAAAFLAQAVRDRRPHR